MLYPTVNSPILGHVFRHESFAYPGPSARMLFQPSLLLTPNFPLGLNLNFSSLDIAFPR